MSTVMPRRRSLIRLGRGLVEQRSQTNVEGFEPRSGTVAGPSWTRVDRRPDLRRGATYNAGRQIPRRSVRQSAAARKRSSSRPGVSPLGSGRFGLRDGRQPRNWRISAAYRVAGRSRKRKLLVRVPCPRESSRRRAPPRTGGRAWTAPVPRHGGVHPMERWRRSRLWVRDASGQLLATQLPPGDIRDACASAWRAASAKHAGSGRSDRLGEQ